MTKHRHSVGGKYTSSVDVPIPSVTGLAKQADLEALAKRVAALEAPVPPPPLPEPEPPPVTPPPVEPPPATGTAVPIGKFVAAVTGAKAGSTLLVAPGLHSIADGPHYLRAANVSIIGQLSPTIKPIARPNGLYIAASGSKTSGLNFASAPGTYADGNGSALYEVLGSGQVIRDTLLEDARFDMPAAADSGQHSIYLNGSIEDLLIRRIVSDGHGGKSAGLHGYHNGATFCDRIVVEDFVAIGHETAVLIWLNVKLITFRRCDFGGYVRLSLNGGTARFEGCKGKGILLDNHNGATKVVDGGGNALAGVG